MNARPSISPGVSAFLARMRVRTQPARCDPIATPDDILVWRVSPASGRLESRWLVKVRIG
ncbi:hypothetical protein ACFPU0_15525 [Pseudomonas sp. GCM10022186]|uniref:hypothetical protein n=1 Tax=Pseudomonas sp. GCM10022186 TaxID=3252650 RepID=UPI00362110C2